MTPEDTASEGLQATTPRAGASVQVGLIVSPAIEEATARRLRDELRDALGRRYPNVDWDLSLVRDVLVDPPVHLTELVDATRNRLLLENWDLAVCVTELPLRVSRRPLLTHASPIHGVALVSLPALGVVQRRRRLLDALVDAVAALIGDLPDHDGKPRRLARRMHVERRLYELATHVDDDPRSQGVAFLARVISGNIRLLGGMIAANHPWRLVGHLSRALLGALAAAAFALVTSDVWRIAASLGPPRLTLLMLGSTGGAVVALITAHQLWEQAPDPYSREQVALFNLATLATVVLGIGSLYATVFAVSLATAGLLIDSTLLASAVHHDVDLWDYLRLAWLASSLATVGGALGATLETDSAVREAAYAYRPSNEAAPAEDVVAVDPGRRPGP
jgi:hypothetical protein